jgi:hypothetical protein
MPARTILEAPQVARLLAMAELSVNEASPLTSIAAATPCSLDGPGGTRLLELKLLVPEDGKPVPRVNSAFRGVLEAAAQPQEVLSLQVTGAQAPGFALCRRGSFWTEATVGPLGVLKLEYPLARDAMLLAVGSALSSRREESPPLLFRFRGPAADLLVLHALVAAGRAGVATEELRATVRRYLEDNTGSLLATTVADPGGVKTLIERSGAATDASYRLAAQGLVSVSDGRATASRAAVAAVSEPAVAGFSASRTAVGDDGALERTSLQAWRAGEHSFVVRAVRLDDGAVGIDARNVGRAELRSLVAALYLREDQLAALAAD